MSTLPVTDMPDLTHAGATIRPVSVWVIHPKVVVVAGPLTKGYPGARIGDDMWLTLKAPFPDWLADLVKEQT